MQLERTIEQWSGMDPHAVFAGSEAQILYCIQDARHDIIALTARVAELEAALKPFAAMDAMLPPNDGLINPGFRPYISELGEAPFRVPDIRRAAALLSGKERS